MVRVRVTVNDVGESRTLTLLEPHIVQGQNDLCPGDNEDVAVTSDTEIGFRPHIRKYDANVRSHTHCNKNK